VQRGRSVAGGGDVVQAIDVIPITTTAQSAARRAR
jgi:hypothetical protein